MHAAIITIGNELLIGQVLDTNSAWIASQLDAIGVRVRRFTSIPDSGEDIKATINQQIKDFDLVITTGGLGPTRDDITLGALCEVFQTRLALHEPTLRFIEGLFAQRGLPLTELNRRQALLPEACQPLPNALGTAPGMWFERDGHILVALPGVPPEMQGIMERQVIPRLAALGRGGVIVHRTIHVFGLPESFLAQTIAPWEDSLPRPLTLAYLPGATSVRLRLTYIGDSKEQAERMIQDRVAALRPLIPEHIFGFDADTLPSVVSALLRERGATLALAESCTGGYLSHLLTEHPGASAFLVGGVVAYTNALKESVLGVKPQILAEHGAVSQPVAEAMAQGARERFAADYAIAITGIAGPQGGSPAKPVGTVWAAVATPGHTVSRRLQLGASRIRNIQRGAHGALNLLRTELLADSP